MLMTLLILSQSFNQSDDSKVYFERAFAYDAEGVKWTPCRGQNVVKISKIFEID